MPQVHVLGDFRPCVQGLDHDFALHLVNLPHLRAVRQPAKVWVLARMRELRNLDLQELLAERDRSLRVRLQPLLAFLARLAATDGDFLSLALHNPQDRVVLGQRIALHDDLEAGLDRLDNARSVLG